jgi:hypothetical protein
MASLIRPSWIEIRVEFEVVETGLRHLAHKPMLRA